MSHSVINHDTQALAERSAQAATPENVGVTAKSDNGASRRAGMLARELVAVVERYRPSPEELRYAFKRVREQTQIRRPVRPRGLPKFYTVAELFAILEAANRIGPERRVFVDVLFQSGLRIQEFRDLDVRDFAAELQGGTVHVRKGKGGKERFVPVTGSLLHEVRLFAGPRRAGPLFQTRTGLPMTTRTFQRWYDEILRAAGVEKKGGPHTARHTFAVLCRMRGVPLEDIQAMLGHSDVTTTQIYARITYTPEQRDRYLRAFESGVR